MAEKQAEHERKRVLDLATLGDDATHRRHDRLLAACGLHRTHAPRPYTRVAGRTQRVVCRGVVARTVEFTQ